MPQERNQLLKNTVALAVARILEKASMVFLSFFIARYLGAAGLGIYSATMVFFGLISLAADMGSATFLVREIAKDRNRTGPYLVHLSFMTILLSCVIMSVSWLLVPHLGYSADLTACVYVVICAMIPATLKTLQEAVFVAHERVEFVTYSTLVAAAIIVGATYYLLSHGYGIVSLVLVYAAVQYVITLCQLFLLNRYLTRLRWSFDHRFALRMVKELRMLAGSSLLAAVSSRPEVMILSFLKSDAQIGLYSAAVRIVDIWQVIPETYMRNVFPLLSRSEHARDQRASGLLLSRSFKYLLAIGLPLTVGIFVAARPIVELIFGPGFEGAVTALRIMTWYIPLGFLHEVLWRLLVARNQQHLLVRAQAITIVVRIAMGYVLISWWASFGAALGATLIMLEHNLLLGFFVRRDGTRLGLFRLAWRLSLAALVMGVLATMLVSRSELWVVVLAAAVSYGTMVFLLKALSSNELALFRTRWQVPSAD